MADPQITQITQITKNLRMEKRDQRTYSIIGAAMEVHRQLGCGFLEAVYREALGLELTAQRVPFKREAELPIFYKGQHLNVFYRADFVCFDSVIVETKALAKLGGTDEAQVINYLKATGYTAGLLLNFGAKSLEYRRFALSKPNDTGAI